MSRSANDRPHLSGHMAVDSANAQHREVFIMKHLTKNLENVKEYKPTGRRCWKWTDKQLDKLNMVLEVFGELEDYKPLTLRQVYYQLVGKGYIDNTVSQYGMLSNLIKWARIDGHIPWKDIEDRIRTYHDLTGWTDRDCFIEEELHHFLTGYRRDLLQTQEHYIEAWIEKDALSSLFTRVATAYTVPVVVCRGFSSVSFLNDFRTRLAGCGDRWPVMLYFGDFDPSGMEMLESMKITLRDELGINQIEFKRIALLKDDIFTYDLPNNPNALKRSDTRAKKHLKAHGELAVELDALRPDILEDRIKEAIEWELDIDAFNAEADRHNSELDKLNELKQKVGAFITERSL